MTRNNFQRKSQTVSFKYDPFGRRIYKSSSAGTSVFAYDSDNLIEETNASGAVVARYAATRNIDETLAMLRSGATSYFQADGLESVTSLSNAAGALAGTYTYDSFGNLTASTGSLTNPFRFTGRESDSETSLYYYRTRYYDPLAGRFLSEDPLRFGGGENFYPYVLNSPIGLSDPMGLSAVDVDRIKAACQKCTEQLQIEGRRLPSAPFGDGSITTLLKGVPFGWANDAGYWFTKQDSCYGQAQRVEPCVASPATPYGDKWNFGVEPIWLWSHRVVVGHSLNPSDPDVVCDPWLNRFFTVPKPKAPKSGGGKK